MSNFSIVQKVNMGLWAFVMIIAFVVQTGAHPLGNFTISHYTRLELTAERVYLRYIIDMAEISTFQEFEVIDTNKNRAPEKQELEVYGQQVAPQYAERLQLSIDDVSIPVRVERQQVLWQLDEGGFPNLRIVCDFVAAVPSAQVGALHRLKLADTNRRERSGWREMVVVPRAGISVFDSTAFGNGITDELKVFPKDLLTALPNEQTIELSFTQGDIPSGAVPLRTREGRNVESQARNQLAEFIAAPNLSIKIGLLGLLLAALMVGYKRFRPMIGNKG